MDRDATRRVLVVCTANVCRSPVAERILRRAFDSRGAQWTVRSAGTTATTAPIDRHTIAVASEAGLDLSDHVRRVLDRDIVSTDGADLVLAMTRDHLRHVVGLDPDAWPRTFTLKELARRAEALSSGLVGVDFEAWRARVAEGRRASELMVPNDADDLVDPYGRSRRYHEAMMEELERAVASLIRDVPWGVSRARPAR